MTEQQVAQPGSAEATAGPGQQAQQASLRLAAPRSAGKAAPRASGFAAAFGSGSGAAWVFRDLASI